MLADKRAEARFNRLYREHYRTVLAYVLRHGPTSASAHDIVQESYLVLWRRLAEAPADDAEVAFWLIAVARRVIANHTRGHIRRERLFARLSQDQRDGFVVVPGVDHGDGRSLFLALLRLKPHEREMLLLAAWDDLSSREIAAVLGCTENAAAVRLHRARKHLVDAYEKEFAAPGHITTKGKSATHASDG